MYIVLDKFIGLEYNISKYWFTLNIVDEMNNLVAKHANQFNKAATHRNKKTDYTRKMKHKNKF